MLRLTTLGAIDLRDHLGRPVRDVLSQPKRIALLVHLALEGRRGPVSRDRVLAMFWPESDEPRARNALSQALYHLRQAIGSDLIVSQGATLELAPDGLWCDALVLEEALANGDAELALDIYKGEFCPVLMVAGAGAVEEWVSETRRDQRRRLLQSARRGLQQLTAAGDSAGAARLARRALQLHPDDERDVREYLTALDVAGDVTGALALYAEYARRVTAELETEPAPETVALVERIRQRRSAAAQAAATAAEPASPSTATSVAPIAGRPSRRPVARVLGVVAAALLLVWGGYSFPWSRPTGRSEDSSAPKAVAVFPFTVRGGDPANMLSDGVAILLATKLDGTDAVRAIDPRSSTTAAEGQTPNPTRADELSRTLGAHYFVLGDLIERAGRLQVDGSLFATGDPGRPIARASVTGDTTAIFELLDDLAGRLLADIVPGRDTALTKLAALTTSSLPALKAYLRGERAMRTGQDARAAAAFREAALLDTTFALAQYRLALVANWISVPGIDDPFVWAQAAARHDQRLTPLGRDLVEAFLAYKLPSSSAAARYLSIVRAYPDNVEAWYMYGEALYHYGPIMGNPATDAREAFERVLTLDPSNSHALVHLARIAAFEGRADEVASLEARHRAGNAEAERTIETRALLAWARKDSAAADAILEEARRVDPIVLYGLTQAAALSSGNMAHARSFAVQLLGANTSPALQTYGRLMVSETTLGAGRERIAPPLPHPTPLDVQWHLEAEVLTAVEPVFATARARLLALRSRVDTEQPFLGLGVPTRSLPAPVRRGAGESMRLHLLGLLDLRLGAAPSARARLDSLDRRAAEADSAFARRLATSLRAELLRSEGRYADALAELERFEFVLTPDRLGHDGIRERFARAELLAALGRTEEARRWFRSFPAYYDLAFLAPAWFREAQLLERAGQRGAARERYQRVLDLWSNADPDRQHLVRDAREALARLR